MYTPIEASARKATAELATPSLAAKLASGPSSWHPGRRRGLLDDLAAAMPAIAVTVGPGWGAMLADLGKTLAPGG